MHRIATRAVNLPFSLAPHLFEAFGVLNPARDARSLLESAFPEMTTTTRGPAVAGRTRAGTVNLAVVRPGLIEITPDEGVKESRPSCSLLECAGFRVLVDLGHPKEDPEQFLSALRVRGLEPADIHAVLFTHLHPDHIGHKDLFPGALFAFHGDERLAFYFGGDRTLRLKGSAVLELRPEAFPSPRYTDEVPELRGLGGRLYVRHCPGHTPGSLVAFAHVGGLVYALAGDIVLDRDHYERGTPPGSSWRPELIPEHMRFIACSADVIIPGHGGPFECRPTPRGREEQAHDP
jgi:glyoxylase-like metal-dependent hydrolase (beta-lactamase superfamily II)